MEIWKEIEGYEGLYEVSNLGRVKSLPKGKHSRKSEMILTLRKHPYKFVNLCKNGKISTKSVHRLVAIAFISNTLNKPVINHIDCNPANNNVSNLEWATELENQMHSRRLGRYKLSDTKSSERFKHFHKNKDNRFNNYSEQN
jgi:hypothetical protein